tara:strand:+ start:1942 stop:2895 length:954 start_codon:yes stop_codon:yes gene_type:complete
MSQNISKILINKNSKNFIITIAIGKTYYDTWKKYASPTWIDYCKKHSLGLMIICNYLIDKDHPKWKKPTWHKMLIGNYIQENKLKIENVCYLDTDILINPNSPNIFTLHNKKKISIISATQRMPYSLNYVKKKIAFNRNNYLDKKYPLDSALFMTKRNYYNFHNFSEQKDIINMGVFIFNVNEHSKLMLSWFNKYDKNLKNLTGGGDNPQMSYEILHYGKLNWLEYKFNCLWNFEMASKYSFLYADKKNKKLIKTCIEDSLKDNYFLHFAGTWKEGSMWKMKNIFNNKKEKSLNRRFLKYLRVKLTGKPKGRILPQK